MAFLSSNMVYFELSNISKEHFEYILKDITTMIVNTYFKQDFTLSNIYNHIAFKDNDMTNLDVNNIVVLESDSMISD